MKVNELIDVLKLCDPDAVVFTCYENDNPMVDTNFVKGVMQIKDYESNTTIAVVKME